MPESLSFPPRLGRCRRWRGTGSLAVSWPLALPALLLAGCAGQPLPPDSLSLVNPRPRSVAPPPQAQAPAAAAIGLQPLPSPEQVSAAVALGRLDPFLDPRPPEALAAAGRPSTGAQSSGPPATGSISAGTTTSASPLVGRSVQPPLVRPPLVLTGVIQTGSGPSAIVQRGSESGSLNAGERGTEENPFLPPGWRVESININKGKMVLRHGSRTEPYSLSEI